MKCARCDHDSKYPERKGATSGPGICPACKGRFAFEPRTGDVVNDMQFKKAIERVSSGGKVKFQPEHVQYELRRRTKPTKWAYLPVGCVGVFTTVAVSLIALKVLQDGKTFDLCGGFVFAVFGLVFGSLWVSGINKRKITRAKFEPLWKRWVEVHGEPAALVPRPRTVAKGATPFPEELLAYSFDRAVICDRPQTVDVLIANQFHFENNCAVLGVGGYPADAFEPVRKMLRNNPRLLVIALHDASVEGCRLAHKLRTDPAWFREGGARVVDIGLRPAHAKKFPGMADDVSDRRVTPEGGISESEANWLRYYELPLAVVRPEQLIKRLFRAITRAEGSSDGGGGGDGGGDSAIIVSHDGSHDGHDGHGHGDSDSDSMGSDADASDGGGDSFG